MYRNDQRIVLTLDAGGTNFVFSALQGNREITQPFSLPAEPNDIKPCLETIENGFCRLQNEVDGEISAISFAFPGPADYKNGVIGDLPNFPAFRGGVALGAFLEDKFNLPVFINNDGNLFAFGEALAGALPMLNDELAKNGNSKRYHNLTALTFGTGFGAGVVINNHLLTGDNGCGGDIWVLRNKIYPDKIVEESVSIRAITRVYNELAKEKNTFLTPKEIFDIAEGNKVGDREAALRSFAQFGEAAGDAIACLQTFTDGIIVLGGGIVGAIKYILPSLKNELNVQLGAFSGQKFDRLQMKALDLSDENDRVEFFKEKATTINVPFSNRKVHYNSVKQTAIVLSSLGTSRAIALGAYSFALSNL
ncbi:MAG: ROK family protein [Prevotellaceae bacterium]|jgi:glucokinase|nr:ROK family protein [Prevotellaceae bacterium]